MAEPTFKIEAASSFHDSEAGANTSSKRRKAPQPQSRPAPEVATKPDIGQVPEETDEHALDTVA